MPLSYAQQLHAEDIEYKIKAGYLYNFTKFITWPDDTSQTFNLCVVGENPFGELLQPIQQRTAFAKPIKLVTLENLAQLRTISKSKPCHIIFFSTSLNDSWRSFRDTQNTLTVGDNEQFASGGGMVGFIAENGRIKLQINWQAAKKAGLKISAQLLEISEIVDTEDTP